MKLRLALPGALIAALAAGCAHTVSPAAGGADGPAARIVSLDTFDGALLGREIFRESNRARAAQGVRPLAPLPALEAAAEAQASWMALMFSAQHTNPAPREHNAAERSGLAGPRVGENVIMVPAQRPAGSPLRDYTYAALAIEIVDTWMNSPGHRTNLLDPGYAYLGCAARASRGALPSDQRVFASQVFCTPIFKDDFGR